MVLIEGFILRELYNKCTRDTDRWTAICENYQEQTDAKAISFIIGWLFQAISNVPSLDFRWCFDQGDCQVRFNNRLAQHIIRRKTRTSVINYVLIDTCHCEQHIRIDSRFDILMNSITPSFIMRNLCKTRIVFAV